MIRFALTAKVDCCHCSETFTQPVPLVSTKRGKLRIDFDALKKLLPEGWAIGNDRYSDEPHEVYCPTHAYLARND